MWLVLIPTCEIIVTLTLFCVDYPDLWDYCDFDLILCGMHLVLLYFVIHCVLCYEVIIPQLPFRCDILEV